MANIKSAKKRIKVSEKNRLRNKQYKSTMKSMISSFEKALETNDQDQMTTKYRAASQYIDKAASKGVIHKNTAARKKSRLVQKLNKAKVS